MIVIFVLVIQTILLLAHYLVYKTVVKFLGITDGTYLLWTRVVFAVLSLSFVLVTLITYKYYGPVGRAFYFASAVWLGTMYWLFFASVISWLVYGVVRVVAPGRNMSGVALGLLILALITSAYGVWNSYQTKVRHVTVTLDNLPVQWKGRTAVLVADTHLGNVRNLKFAQTVSKLIEAQKPNIVFIPGDFYDGPPTDYDAVASPFGRISAPFGVYLAPGNHEEFGDPTSLLEKISASGVRVLNDEAVIIDGLQIIGVGYGTTTNADRQRELLNTMHIDKAIPSILIKHAPTHIAVAEEAGISFQVSGHTHLGQVYPLRYITRAIYGPFHYGLQSLGAAQVLTTSGVGTWGPPQRVGTNSEIVVITFN